MDDWQDAAFSSRHMHNRNGRGSKSKHTAAFDVRKTFASYSVKCPAWQKALSANGDAPPEQDASLELYRLTEGGEGVVGRLSLPGVLQASVILAGSRDSLRRTIAEVEPDESNEEEDDGHDDEEEEESDNTEPESPEKTRFETFEKNSFRSPKFWFRWSGEFLDAAQSVSRKTGSHETELGYIVFAGNDCRKFKGTINCTNLKWKNVAITGHKLVARSTSDAQVTWGKAGVPI
ncbi:hypothetical protein GT037_001082 [Alternaria burnsii]|uniref:Uncharacterized protein n=1 Tax=Alternaria burnsii TaxID=1187904 RepID=A0A8H7BFF0_9PLEO|nr:uncharacterized protein GT037_001082 [Alternaria burnsii]KAF7682106.1 hypothetical protein GT037_001082 [Alternaria burnsii]CAI9636057.1 unnamed protein product [Alternaria burnsii]